ncbi:MAG: hypothetical protein QOG62_29 [Thermoleophilaceae bacterium]|nr:hypothetical protein [Thermoleophilaceae bacterium]
METGITRGRLADQAADRFVSLRRDLGVTSFGINQIILAAGERGRIHRHKVQEEVFLVLEGTLTLVVDGDDMQLGEGEIVRVGPEVRRQLVNHGPDRLVLLALGGSAEHVGRDGLAYADWDTPEEDARAPQEVPLPEDLPARG